MFTKHYTFIALATVMLFVTATGIAVAEDTPGIVISPKRQAFYAGGPFSVDMSSTLTNTPINYRLQFANRTLSRGTITPKNAGTTQLNLEFPELKQGVVVDAQLTCFTDTTEVTKTLYMFSRQGLIDGIDTVSYWHTPEASTLRDALATAGVTVTACDDISQATADAVIIEGMNVDDNPGIMNTLSAQCNAGKRLIMINPVGTLPWPQHAEKVVLERPTFATTLNKRLDVLPMTHALVAGELDGKPALKVQPGNKGFCICRLQIGEGELIILTCQFREVVSENPTPLYIIKSLLKHKEKNNE